MQAGSDPCAHQPAAADPSIFNLKESVDQLPSQKTDETLIAHTPAVPSTAVNQTPTGPKLVGGQDLRAAGPTLSFSRAPIAATRRGASLSKPPMITLSRLPLPVVSEHHESADVNEAAQKQADPAAPASKEPDSEANVEQGSQDGLNSSHTDNAAKWPSG